MKETPIKKKVPAKKEATENTFPVVDNHNGIVTVKSEVSKGTTFSIYIPSLVED